MGKIIKYKLAPLRYIQKNLHIDHLNKVIGNLFSDK